MKFLNQGGFSITSAILTLGLLIGLIGFFSYQYKRFATSEVFLSVTIFLAAFGVISVYFVYLNRKSKSENNPKSEIVFEESYKSSIRTYYLYAFVIYLTVFIFLYLFAFNPSASNTRPYQIFYILLIIGTLLAPFQLWLINWIYDDAKRRNMNVGLWGLSLGSTLHGQSILNFFIFPFLILSYFTKMKNHPIVNTSSIKSISLKQLIKPTLIWSFFVILTTWLFLSYIPSITSYGSMVR